MSDSHIRSRQSAIYFSFRVKGLRDWLGQLAGSSVLESGCKKESGLCSLPRPSCPVPFPSNLLEFTACVRILSCRLLTHPGAAVLHPALVQLLLVALRLADDERPTAHGLRLVVLIFGQNNSPRPTLYPDSRASCSLRASGRCAILIFVSTLWARPCRRPEAGCRVLRRAGWSTG